MLEAILQAPFSNFLNEMEPGTWIPLGVFVLHDNNHRSKMILDLISLRLALLKTARKGFLLYEIEMEKRGAYR